MSTELNKEEKKLNKILVISLQALYLISSACLMYDYFYVSNICKNICILSHNLVFIFLVSIMILLVLVFNVGVELVILADTQGVESDKTMEALKKLLEILENMHKPRKLSKRIISRLFSVIFLTGMIIYGKLNIVIFYMLSTIYIWYLKTNRLKRIKEYISIK